MFNFSEKYADDADFTFAMSVYQIIRAIPDSRRKQRVQGDVLNTLNDLKFDVLEEQESRKQGLSSRQQEFANRGHESTQANLCHQQGNRQQEYDMQWTSQGQKSITQEGNYRVHSGIQRQQLQSNEAHGHHSQELSEITSGNWLMNQPGLDRVWGQG